jgi:hypothetical protein
MPIDRQVAKTMTRLAWIAALSASVALMPGSTARAQEMAGAINAGVIVADGDVGGGSWLDVWAAFDWLRVGGFVGAMTIPSSRDARDRFAAPIGVSLATVFDLGDVDLDLRYRGGIWVGSTQAEKMTMGGFVGGAAFVDVHLGGGASLGVGMEVWGILGNGPDVLGPGATWAVTPSLTLTWGPPPPERTSSPSPDLGGMTFPT